jgi:X-X-X-Leu-X-X-Gly heptad repeat protein
MGHVGCLMVARVDGKSPVEYLTSAERDTARRIGLGLVSRPPDTIEEGLARLRAGTGQWSSGTVNTVGKEGKSE